MLVPKTKPYQVDFHCHLDLYPNHLRAVETREHEKIYTLAVTTTPRAWPRNRQFETDSKYVRAALGLHPQLVATHASELNIWKYFLPETRYVGEVGLDASPSHYKSLGIQKKVFAEILKTCAIAGDKILSIHSVRSSKVVLDMIEAYFPVEKGKIVLHWFSGSKSEVRRAVDLGCFFSVNKKMIESKNGQILVQTIPIERILTETDGPFTEKKDTDLPSNLDTVIDGIAKLKYKNNMDLTRDIIKNLNVLLEV